MNKSDLKNGYVVDLRVNGYRRVVLFDELLIEENGGYERASSLIEKYRYDLKHRSDSSLDIVKVYDGGMNLIWERKEIDWSKAPKDTKVLVGNLSGQEEKRYFAEYKNGKFYTYGNGQTSWSKDDCELVEWKYCKLAEEPKEEVTFDDIDKKNPFLLYNS